MICANGHKSLLEDLLKIVNEKYPNEKEKFINHKNCDGNTPLRIFPYEKLFCCYDIY